MTPEQRKLEEEQIQTDFSELQKKLEGLKNEVQTESDDSKKQEKNEEIQKLEKELSEMKTQIESLRSLQEADMQSLKNRLESVKNTIQNFRWEVADLQHEKTSMPTTYELLKDSDTTRRLLTIISSNPDKFKKIQWESAEKKLEYIFSKIRNSIVLFMKNKLWNSENAEKVISNTIAPAFERNLMEMLRNQWNETNVGMLQWMDKISFDSFNKLVKWVSNFAKKASWSYNKFSQWMNAVDYLSVHNWVLRYPDKSEVLSNPLKFQEYMNDTRFASNGFSPYVSIPDNIFKVDENQTFEFGMSLPEKQKVLSEIWNIQVVNNPKTTALIASMLDKPEKFFKATEWLQQTANGLLDGVNSLNSVTKIFGVDILWEITKSPEERGFLFKIIDFVCKLIWITWWLEWIVKRWRLDRMNLIDEKNENISQIFKKYKELAWENVSLSITDENSCKTALSDFAVTELDKQSTTKWDYLRDVMVGNMNINLISPAIVQQTLWNDYLKKETITVNWKQQEKITIDSSKITEDKKKELVHKHLINMKIHLESNFNDLKDFYTNIHGTDDIALCITASLYADKNDVIEWVKAKVFLPENYGSVRTDGTVEDSSSGNINLPELSTTEKAEMQNLVEQSKTPNTINYLNNSTYKKYLNIIEHDLNLPRYALECVCNQESRWKLYSWNKILWSSAWAKWLFQFMPGTADTYMKHNQLATKYWKTFTSRDEFLKDPLASAWAAWIMYSEFMHKYNYNFQSSLACYNRWIGNYQKHFGNKNLSSWDLAKLPVETKWYVEKISKDILEHNWDSSNDVLLADLWKYSWSSWNPETPESNNELLIWPRLLAHNKDEIWWLWNSIMNGFQWLNNKSQFPNMDWIVWKNTQTHPNRFNSQNDVLAYKNSHPDVKSFMFYFWANNNNNQQTLSDIKKRSEWLESGWIQPVLCTCVWENSEKTPWLKELNQQLIGLWKEKSWPVVDFAKSNNNWDIDLSSDWVHPKSYSPMTNIVNSLLQA